MQIKILVENNELKMNPRGENLSKENIIEALSLAYCSACKGYGVDMAECASYIMGVASDVYYDDKATLERIKKIAEYEKPKDALLKVADFMCRQDNSMLKGEI